MENIEQPINRESFDTAFINLISNTSYQKLSFYSFVISKMSVQINRTVPTAAVGFYNNKFNIIINDLFFDSLSMDERIAVLIHETHHIILQHIFRRDQRDPKLFNIAADIAINQNIINIPEGGMFPSTFDFPENLSAEQYYVLLQKEKEEQEQEKEQDGESSEDGDSQDGEDGDSQDGQGNWSPSTGHPDLTGDEELTIDSHDLWSELSPEDQELAKSTMKKTLDEAIQKSKGNVPNDIESLLELWRIKAKISWKKELKKIVTSKIGSKIGTIKRRDRRLPNRMDVKGKKSFYDNPEVIVLLDVSGSVSNEELASGLVEINEICKVTNSNLNLIQVDTQAGKLEEYNPKKKTFKRSKGGGTYIAAGIKQVQDDKISCDVVVVVTDGYIEDVSTDQYWKAFKKPVLFLSTTGDMTPVCRKHKVFNIVNA